MSRAYQVKAATAAQKETLTALGYTAQKIYWKAWTYDDAEKLIAVRCAYLGISAPGDKPLLLTAWQRAEVMLLSGYIVHPMPQDLCYEVRGGKETYHVCLDKDNPAYGCSCPQGILKGETRACKHSRLVMLSLYKWAEASQEGVEPYADLFRDLGITALHAGSRAPVEVQGRLLEAASELRREEAA